MFRRGRDAHKSRPERSAADRISDPRTHVNADGFSVVSRVRVARSVTHVDCDREAEHRPIVRTDKRGNAPDDRQLHGLPCG
jgi:hypothetical protein